MVKAIAPERAGEEGWSVIVTVDALARAQMTEGRAAPVLYQSELDDRGCVDFYNPEDGSHSPAPSSSTLSPLTLHISRVSFCVFVSALV